ncbi:MAG: hypothetical protein V3T58_06765 [Candidatus Hydrothermarchaeales archaeon]
MRKIRKKLATTNVAKKIFAIALVFIFISILLSPAWAVSSSTSELKKSHGEGGVQEPEGVMKHGEAVAVERKAEVHEERDHEVADHEHEAAHEEPWWRFRGFEAVFAVFACLYFFLAVKGLPLILEDKSMGRRH